METGGTETFGRSVNAAAVGATVFVIDEAPQAYAHLAKGGQHFGKIAIAH